MEAKLTELSEKNFYIFVLLILPGFIAQSTYDLFVPAKERDAAANFFLGLAYGTLNLALTWPAIFWASSVLTEANEPICESVTAYAALLFSLAIFPAFLGVIAFRLRVSEWLRKWVPMNPSPTAWDNFFARGNRCWVIFHLKSGRRVGGHYADGSHASMFPNDADVYVSETWRLNEYNQFEESIEQTMGMLIRRDDCELIEFFKES